MITEQEVNKVLRVSNVIFYTILLLLFAYLFVCLIFIKNPKTSINADTLITFRTALYGLSFVVLLITKRFKNFILRKAIGRKKSTRQTGPLLYPEVQRYMTAMINACALTESIGICGVVLYILGGNPVDIYVLIAVSAVAMLQHRPNKEELLSLFKDGSMDQSNEAGRY
jgi:hypothetical protein